MKDFTASNFKPHTPRRVTVISPSPSRALDRLDGYKHGHGEADESYSSFVVVLDCLQSNSQANRTYTRRR